MNELTVQGLVGILRTRLAGDLLLPDLCFHAMPYTENLCNFLGTLVEKHQSNLYTFVLSVWELMENIYLITAGGCMWTLPDFSRVILSKHRYPSCSKQEQIVILTLTGHNIMEEGINLLHKVLTGNAAGARTTCRSYPSFTSSVFHSLIFWNHPVSFRGQQVHDWEGQHILDVVLKTRSKNDFNLEISYIVCKTTHSKHKTLTWQMIQFWTVYRPIL